MLVRRGRYRAWLGLGLWLTLGVPAADAATLEAATRDASALPDERITLVFRAEDGDGQLHPAELTLPSGWRALLPEEPFAVAPGERAVRVVVVATPAQARPGTYALTYGWAGAEAIARVDVAETRGLALAVQADRVQVPSGDTVPVTWQLHNEGNTPRRLLVRVIPRNLRADPSEPVRVEVPPFGTHVHTFDARIADDATHATLAVEVVDADTPSESAQRGFVRFDVLPRSGKVDRFRRLPLSATLWNRTGTGLDGTLRTALQGELTAQGPLDAGQKVHLDALARGPTVRSVPGLQRFDEYRATLTAGHGPWRTRLHLGDGGYHFTPLTLRGMIGRGAAASVRVNALEVGGFAAQRRYVERSPWQIGGFFRAYPFERAWFSVNTLLSRLPGRNAWTFSHEGQLELTRPESRHAVRLGYEAALGDGAPGGHLRLDGAARHTRYWLSSFFGAPGFPGEWANRWLTTAGAFQRVGAFTLSPNLQLVLSDLAGTNPSRTSTTWISSVRGTWDASDRVTADLSWRHQDGRDRFTDRDLFLVEDMFTAGARARYGETRVRGEVGGRLRRRDDFGDKTSTSVFGTVEAQHDLSHGVHATLGAYVDSNFRRQPGPSWLVAPYTRWTWATGPAQRVTLTYSPRWYAAPYAQLQQLAFLDAAIRLPWGHWIRSNVLLNLSSRPDTPTDVRLDATVGYTAVLGLPIGRRKDLMVVRGQVLDHATGLPATGIPVALDGYALRTDEQGMYAFDADPTRRHLLEIPSFALDPGLAVLPRGQVDLTPTGPADEAHEQIHDFTVVRGGSVRVRVVRYRLDGSPYLLEGQTARYIEEGPVALAQIDLRGDQGLRRLFTDADGVVRFDRIPTGTWELVSRPGQLGRDETVEDGARLIEILPGDAQEILVRVLPQVRRIRFVDSEEEATAVTTLAPRPGKPVAVTGLRLTPSSIVVAPGAEIPVSAQLIYADGRTEEATAAVQWAIADSEIATVEGGVVRGVTPGQTTMTATLAGRMAGPMPIEVVEVPYMGLQAAPKALALAPGASAPLTGTAIEAGGALTNVTGQVEWVSRDPSIATVDAAGVVTAVAPGQTVIVGRLFGLVAFPVEVTVEGAAD